MTEREIQEIVQLIVKGILQQSYEEKTHEKILVVLGTTKDELFANEYFENKKSECLRTTIIASERYEDTFKGNTAQELADNHERIILLGLTLKQLIRISEFQLADPITELVTEALRQGKQVVLISDRINTKKATPALAKKIDELKTTLKMYGVTIDEGISPNHTVAGNPMESTESARKRIDKKVIAKQDLKNTLSGVLEIRDDAVFTTTAKNLIEKREIRVIRYKA